MALRLAGEEFSIVQGLDAQGWPREVRASDGNPGLQIRQDGASPSLELYDGATKVLRAPDGGGLELLVGSLDVRTSLKNTGSATGGALGVDDTLWVAGDVHIYSSGALGGTKRLFVRAGWHTLALLESFGMMPDAEVEENYGHLYIYNNGTGTRQLVIKYKDAGVVYTGTVNLA